jgi:hypothetical protein
LNVTNVGSSDISNCIYIDNSYNDTTSLKINQPSSTDGSGNLIECVTDGTTNVFHVKNDGNVGIGTDSPSEALDVSGNTKLYGKLDVSGNTTLHGTVDVDGNTNLNGTLDVTGNTILHSDVDICGNVYIDDGKTIYFSPQNPTKGIQIDSSSITGQLHNSLTIGSMGNQNTEGIIFKDVRLTSSEPDTYNDNTLMFISANGNVGIGDKYTGINVPGTDTTDLIPTEKLEVNGNIHIVDESNLYIGEGSGTLSNNLILNHNATHSSIQYGTGDLHFKDKSGSKKMTLLQNGNLGIGTDTPSEKLDVTGNIHCSGSITAGSFIADSDRNLKQNIVPIECALDKVCCLEGVHYEFKNAPDVKRMGLIAQDVEKIIPEVVSENNEGTKGIDYGPIVSILIESVKELKEENRKLNKKIEDMQK